MPVRIPIVVPAEGHPYLTARVYWLQKGSGASINFAIDTGAFDITLSEADAKKLGCEPRDLAHSRKVVGGAGGRVRALEMKDIAIIFVDPKGKSRDIHLDEIMVIANPPVKRVVERAMPLPSLLGRRFLEQNRCTLYWDFGNRMAYLDI